MHSERMRQWARIKTQEIPSKPKKSFFIAQVVEQWDRLLREEVEFPSWEILDIQLDVILGNLLQLCSEQRGELEDLQRSLPASAVLQLCNCL